jgi:CelD/BcsL family acetyltransferase involved in cellulose biosynthesis
MLNAAVAHPLVSTTRLTRKLEESVRVEMARSAAEMERLREPWEELQRAPGATMFQSFEWNLLAVRMLGEVPYVVFAESDAGAALIPAARGDGCLTLIGGTLFDYRDILQDGDEAPLRAAWAELATLGLPLRFRAVRGVHRHWQTLAPRSFCGAPEIRRERLSADQFAAAHPRLPRGLRRLRAAGLDLGRTDGSARELLLSIWQQKAAQFGAVRENAFADPRTVEFLLAVARVTPCEVFYLAAGTQLAAALVAFQDGGARRFYTTWFDPAWARLSPGTALCFEAARSSMADGYDVDLMTGEQPYKTRLATGSVPLFEVDATAEQVRRLGSATAPAVVAA